MKSLNSYVASVALRFFLDNWSRNIVDDIIPSKSDCPIDKPGGPGGPGGPAGPTSPRIPSFPAFLETVFSHLLSHKNGCQIIWEPRWKRETESERYGGN